MPDTYTCTLMHLVWSTKDRVDLIPADLENDLYAYLGGICRGLDCVLMSAGGTANHVHLLVSQSKTISLSDLLLNLKRDSSRWMHERVPRFAWQTGYGGFSIGQSGVEGVRTYIARQKEHHRAVSFEEEFVELLRRYKVEFDPAKMWD